jgi:hypothetical protein
MGVVDTATNIGICNEALGNIAADAIVLNTASANRTYCELFFARAYKEILASHFWNFATKRAYAVQTANPLYGYDYAYTIPTDCIRIWKVDDKADTEWKRVGGTIHTDSGDDPEAWVTGTAYIAGQYVTNDDVTYLCILAHTAGDADDEPGVGADNADYWTSQSGDYKVIPIEYVYDVTDLSTWPDYVIQCVIYNLSIKLAPPIKANEEAAVNFMKLLFDPKAGFLTLAKSSDAQEGGGTKLTTNTWLDSREASYYYA